MIIAAVVAALVNFAHAAEWNFYRSARVSTFYENVDVSGLETNNFNMTLQENSRIGAKVKVSDQISGRFEYGASDGNADLRYLYGIWNFGAGALLVGQHEGPLRHPGSDQVYAVDAGLGGWGENVGNLVDTDVNGGDTGAGLAWYDGTRVVDNKAFAWKIHATYIFNDMCGIQAGYGYMKTELDNQSKDEVQSYYVQVPITLAAGVSIVPEIGTLDYNESGQNQTDYIGAKWQIDF